ncbi:catalase [Acaricomes phytoseiuli]|uniref:catalase n=1 Tax=Acaricomes phytoseiuli TaxID=291968 RepID=UPI002223C9D5|nr:catalase [Acaricomes phytoseiuli]MCW1250086.1 catalase [Acaricomes phytoseiuli]
MPSMHPEESGSTTGWGAPAPSDQNSLTAGPNGPIFLHDGHFVDQMAHFNRQNVPERLPHAKGSSAFGRLTITEDVSAFTRAAVFQKNTTTKALVRFSTVAGELGSPDTWRDIRGFSMKFYTSEGNLDIVGNHTPIFFVRDPMKFPHFIRSQKRQPDTGLRDATMQWDFCSLSPETSHQVAYIMGPRGLPRTWRHMNGYGSNTFMWVNAGGERFWIKYHFHTQQGMEYLSNSEAEALSGTDSDFHRRDLFEAIRAGDAPRWSFSVQVMPYEEAASYRFNPFDLTKTWSHRDYPLIPVGELILDTNPENHFAQIEQAAFSPANLVPGVGLSPDKMLLGRVFAYGDAQRYRIGPNFMQLPVNRPVAPVQTYQFDGPMTYDHTRDLPRYAPNSFDRPWSDKGADLEESWATDTEIVRAAYELHSEDDDFGQAGTLVRDIFTAEEREDLVYTVAGALGRIRHDGVLGRAVEYWRKIDPATGDRVAQIVKPSDEDRPAAAE